MNPLSITKKTPKKLSLVFDISIPRQLEPSRGIKIRFETVGFRGKWVNLNADKYQTK